jgi:hypothetical protein
MYLSLDPQAKCWPVGECDSDRVCALMSWGSAGLPGSSARSLVAPLGSGWSGRCGVWTAGGVEQPFPAVRPGPVLGQVDDRLAGPTWRAREGDQLPADSRAGGFGMQGRGLGAGNSGRLNAIAANTGQGVWRKRR